MSAVADGPAPGSRSRIHGDDAMNVERRPHPASPRIPLILHIAVFVASIIGIVVVLLPFLKGRPDGLLARPLGAPLSVAVCAAGAMLSAWWFVSSEARRVGHAVLAVSLVVLPLAGVLGAAQGAGEFTQRWGGIAGRNLAWPFLTKLGTGAVVPAVFYGALLAFGLFFLRRAVAAARGPEDASAVLARLARQRAGLAPAPAEVPPPAPDEGLGLPTPVGLAAGELFSADAELAAVAVADPETDESEAPAVVVVDEEPAVEEPPPPPPRRRLLREIVSREEFEVEEREDAAALAAVPTAAPVATEPLAEAPAAPTTLADVFGVGVIDVDDEEDVLTPPVVETPPVAAAPAVVVDDRERPEDAVEIADEAGGPREEQGPLFVPPPRTTPFEDDDVGDVDDLPTDDDPSGRVAAEPATAAAGVPFFIPPLAEPTTEEEIPVGTSFDELPTPPSARYDADVVGGRTGEAPRRALIDDETPAVADVPAESAALPAAPALEAQAGLFAEETPAVSPLETPAASDADADAATTEAAEAAPKKRRARAPRPKRTVEPEGEAALEASAEIEGAPATFDEDEAAPALPRFPAAESPERDEPATEPEAPLSEAPPFAAAAPPVVEPTPARAPKASVARTTRTAPPQTPADADFETLVARATEVVVIAQRCSPSLLQRELGVRFVEAAAVIERLHARGVVGPHTPSGVRDVLIRSGAAEA
jgi:hypothetical protein